MLKFTVMAAVAIVFPIALLSQTAPNNAFAGTWKLNAAKSKFNPGPGVKSETVTIPAGEGKVEIHSVGADDKDVSWSYMGSNGATVPIDGLEGSTVLGKNTSASRIDHTWKLPDFTGTGYAVLSKSGKIMTYKMNGVDTKGEPVHNVMIFEKQ
jgi:hypothetical protein